MDDDETLDAAADAIDSVKFEPEFDYTLSKPLNVGDKVYESLHFDFNSVTFNDLDQMERRLEQQGRIVPVRAISIAFQMMFLAKAANIPLPVIKQLRADDGSALAMRAQNFLMVRASAT